MPTGAALAYTAEAGWHLVPAPALLDLIEAEPKRPRQVRHATLAVLFRRIRTEMQADDGQRAGGR